MRTERIEPRASLLIQSMRDIGYSLETALADILDNSITAGAQHVRMLADTSSHSPAFGILDDGQGMDEGQLLQAMRLGSQSPLDLREGDDLGRFGLGLKTASFSQCRRLTVLSRKAGVSACARWDLKYVGETDDWLVQFPDDATGVPWADELGPQGTLVVWEDLDRLTDATEQGRQHLVAKIDEAMEHISLVFHRFLAGEKGLKKVQISINDTLLEPFDPFHSTHPATDVGNVEKLRLAGHQVTVQAFTLPHHQKVSPSEWQKYGGRAGYIKNQGFYVYRGKRLIIHGTWFGLARQMELTKLARVRIDMPNSLDIDWKIDVKKASANPPRQVKERLRALIESIGGASTRVFTTKGKRLIADNKLPVWYRHQNKNLISYGLNPDHPIFTSFMDRLDDDTRDDFLKIMEMAGSTLPVDALVADIGANPEYVGGDAMSPEAIKHAVSATYTQLTSAGFDKAQILGMLQAADPFRSRWELTKQIIQDTLDEETVHD